MIQRNTKQKTEIIKFFENNKSNSYTAYELKDKIGSNAGLTTIYRILNSLTKENVLTKSPLQEKSGFSYKYNEIEQCDNHNKHYHLICENCNKLFHYDNENISKMCKKIQKESDFQIEEEKIVFYGKCKECKK